jgi:hypothetical protein
MAVFAFAACNKSGETVAVKGAPTVVTFGTHWRAGDDPTYRDEITGEPDMSPEDRRIAETAAQKVLDDLNVKIVWVQFANDTREDILRSVLAGDPICDVALLWGGSQGTILGQNVMQDLTPYQDIFTGESDSAWMLMDPVFGHRYFLANELAQVKTWPLSFNINYIEKVDALKENGQTVYPTDLYKQGKWTWSVFEDYLDKINAYYRNTPSPTRPEIPIKAYQTDYRYTAKSLLHTAGQAIYGVDGFMVDTPQAIAAIEYLTRLMDRGLLMSVRYEDTSVVPGWTWNGSDFGNGETVFTDMVPWLGGSASDGLASRGESMGIVPFPRPDSMAFNDSAYEQASTTGNTFCLLKGVSADQSRLALEAFKLYYLTMFRERAGSDRALDFLDTTAEVNAAAAGYDVFHEKIGPDILEIYANYSPASPNEYADMLGIHDPFLEQVVGQSIYGYDGSPRYAVNVAQKLNVIEELLASTERAISSGRIIDNIQPSLSAVSTIAVPRGTAGAAVDFSSFISITDNIDGTIDPKKASYDYGSPDFTKIGVYEGGNGLHVTVKDAAGNERKSDFAVVVYDGDNKQAPVIKPKAALPAVAIGADLAGIDWKGAYIDTATDKDGLDLKSNLSADTSGLDVTRAGSYSVALTVTDFAGNAASVTLQVSVE